MHSPLIVQTREEEMSPLWALYVVGCSGRAPAAAVFISGEKPRHTPVQVGTYYESVVVPFSTVVRIKGGRL